MSEGYNRVMLLGSLGADPEYRVTQGGQGVLNMRLATNESYFDKKQNKRVERTDWHTVVLWGARAEALSKFLAKGASIFVEGSLRTSSYDNREGVKVWKTEVVATNVILAGGKRDGAARTDDGYAPQGRSEGGGYSRGGGNGGGAARAPEDIVETPPDVGGFGTDDDIPFLSATGCGPWRV